LDVPGSASLSRWNGFCVDFRTVDTLNALQLPKDAKQIAPFAWSLTDSNGKKWIYRKTPFGLVRSEDKL